MFTRRNTATVERINRELAGPYNRREVSSKDHFDKKLSLLRDSIRHISGKLSASQQAEKRARIELGSFGSLDSGSAGSQGNIGLSDDSVL